MNTNDDDKTVYLEYYQNFGKGVKSFIKRVIRKIIKPIVYPLVFQQNNYNKELLNKITVAENKLIQNNLELEKVLTKLSEQETKLSEQETKLSEQETKLSEQEIKLSEQEIEFDNFKSKNSYELFSEKLYNDDLLLREINNKTLHYTTCYGDWNRVHIGTNVNLDNTMFNTNSGDIYIGDYSFTGQNVSIITGSHEITHINRLRQNFSNKNRDIVIGKGVWICSGAIILGPCEIGDNAVVAAGSVVLPNTKIESGTLYAGVPATRKKELKFDEKAFNFYPFGSEKSPVSVDLLPYMFTNDLSEKQKDKILLHKNGLVFGPYMDILTGEYKLQVNCEDLTSDMLLNVTAENGTKQISCFTLKNGENSLKIDFDEEINKNVEFVIHSSEEFIITGISIKR